MKKLMLLFFTLLPIMVFSGCLEEDCRLNVWLLGDTSVNNVNNEFNARIGFRQRNTEFGIGSSWWNRDGPHQMASSYVIQHLANDPNNVLGQPYIGARITLDLDDDGGMYGFPAGFILNVSGINIATEYRYMIIDKALRKAAGDSIAEHQVFVGPIIAF